MSQLSPAEALGNAGRVFRRTYMSLEWTSGSKFQGKNVCKSVGRLKDSAVSEEEDPNPNVLDRSRRVLLCVFAFVCS
jgi:hypothetical protein